MRIERIESRENRRLVDARKVRDGRLPGSIFIEGRRLADEALSSGVEIEQCLITEDWIDDDLVDESLGNDVPVGLLSDKLFRSIGDTENPQGILLIGKRPTTSLDQVQVRLRTASLPGLIYLFRVNNPANLGAVARTAEAAGAAGLILSPGSADPFSPKALRASMGSAFRLPIVEKAAFDLASRWARENGMSIFATAADAESSYLQVDWTEPWMLVFGSEAHGLGSTEMGQAQRMIRIPMSDGVESLNLAVSVGIIAFEARRQVG